MTTQHLDNGVSMTVRQDGAHVETLVEGFKTKEEAINFQLDFADSYPVWGYGTSFNLYKNKENNTYSVRARRYISCD